MLEDVRGRRRIGDEPINVGVRDAIGGEEACALVVTGKQRRTNRSFLVFVLPQALTKVDQDDVWPAAGLRSPAVHLEYTPGERSPTTAKAFTMS